MEEDKVLFPEDDEDGVPQLWQLGQGEQPRPEGGHLGTSRRAFGRRVDLLRPLCSALD